MDEKEYEEEEKGRDSLNVTLAEGFHLEVAPLWCRVEFPLMLEQSWYLLNEEPPVSEQNMLFSHNLSATNLSSKCRVT